jgi:hypothetical protein
MPIAAKIGWKGNAMANLAVRRALDTLKGFTGQMDSFREMPDPEAAVLLTQWLELLEAADRLHAVSYGQRLVIIRHFEERALWQHLIDPATDLPFASMTAWLSSGFAGCRRVNMEAHRDAQALADIPAEHLQGVPKGAIKVLRSVSPAVRRLPEVLEAAKSEEGLLEKLEADHPMQHLEVRKPMMLRMTQAQRAVVAEWVNYAVEHDLAGNREEAVMMACYTALEAERHAISEAEG